MGNWKEVRLERESSVATTREPAEETEATLGDITVRIADLAAKGSVVAIAAAAADDPDFQYYLLKVTSNGLEALEEATTDDYGCTFPRGSAGLRGNFFIKDNIIDTTYKLAKKKCICSCRHCATCAWRIKEKEKQHLVPMDADGCRRRKYCLFVNLHSVQKYIYILYFSHYSQ